MSELNGGIPIEVDPTIELHARVEMGGTASEYNAEAWAVGERGGVPVSSTDQTYHNNAKYYAQAAEDAAETASAAYGTDLLAPTYSASETYAIGDHVIYNGGYYACNTAITTAEAWTAAHWTRLTVGGEASDLKSAIDIVESSVYKDETSSISYSNNHYWNVETDTAANASATGWANGELAVEEGEIYEVTACQGAGTKTRIWVVTDASYNVISKADNYYTTSYVKYTSIVVVPNGGKKLLITYFNTSDVSTPKVTVTKKNIAAGIDRGIIANLGYTSLLQCRRNGFYRSGAAYISSINDMPSDYAGGAFNLYVTHPSFAADTWIRQEIVDAYGNSWSRIINYSNGSWSAYTEWIKLALEKDIVTKTVFDSAAYKKQNMSPFFNTNSYWDISNGETAVYTTFTGVWRASNPIDVKPGETYSYTANQGASNKIRLWVVTDDEYNIISMADNHYGATVVTLTFTIPENGTKLLLMQYESTYRRLYKIVSYGDKPLNGLRLSLLGDSISSYSGYVPEGNDYYYNGTSNGIGNVGQIWWNVLCNETGMTPLVIDAWSGSCVCYNCATDGTHSDTNKTPMCSDLRTGRLASGGVSPDIIIITGGTNDWTYSKSTTTPLGEWDGRTAVSREDVLAGESTFVKSYASMIATLQTNYPNAIIVCASLFFTCRGTDFGITRVNDMGYTENDYSEAIRNVCKIMGVPFIDIYDVGFTYENYYPTYAQDSSTLATHPNAKGHLVLAKRFIEELPKVVQQFKY